MSCSMMVRAIPRPGQSDRLKRLVARLAEDTRLEAGNIRFEALSEAGGTVVIFEEYRDDEAFQSHLQKPHTREFSAALERIAEGSRATVIPLVPVNLS